MARKREASYCSYTREQDRWMGVQSASQTTPIRTPVYLMYFVDTQLLTRAV